MRKTCTTLLLLLVTLLAFAGSKITREYIQKPLAEVLIDIDKAAPEMHISFIYDKLEDYPVTCKLENAEPIEAIYQVIGFYPVKVSQTDEHVLVEPIYDTEKKLCGRIVDERGRPLEFANIALLTLTDSTLISGGVANASGDFVIPCSRERVLLRASYIGYTTEYLKCGIENVGAIQLMPDAIALGEVKVKGHAPQFKMTLGGMSVNVDGTLLAHAGTAEDLLGQLPRVSVENGSVKVFAKGSPLIYINNRKMIDPLELQRLRSEDIKSVEVITNPGAEYSAEVESVIKIYTKRNEGQGYSVSNHANAQYNKWLGGYEQIVLKYYTPKLEIKNNAWVQRQKFGEDNDLNQSATLNGKEIKIFQHMNSHMAANWTISESASVSYAVNDSNSIGASYNYYRAPYKHIPYTGTQTIWSDDVREGEVTNRGTISWYNYSHTANIYYNGKLGGWGVNFDATYYLDDNKRREENLEMSEELESREVHTNSDQRNEMWAGKVVASRSVLGGNMSVGTEYTSTSSSGISSNVEGYIKSSKTDINESNLSAFAQYSRQFGAFGLTAGVRYEHINHDYFYFGKRDDDVSRKYSNIFPALSLSWNKGEWNAQLAYNQKTHRPSYRSLRDFMQYDNRYMYEGGNPQLQPEIVHNIELSGLWRWMSLTAGYKYTKDVMAWVKAPLEDLGVVYLTNHNFDHTQDLYASLVLSPMFGKYQPQLELEYKHSLFEAKKNGAERDLSKPGFSANLVNRFAFSKTFTGSFTLYAATRQYEGFRMINETFDASASLRKTLKGNRWTVQLNAYDIFRTLRERWTMYGQGTMSTKDCYNYEQQLSLTVSYNFNQKRDKYKGSGAGNEERRRM